MEKISEITLATWATFSMSVTSGPETESCLLNVRWLMTAGEAGARRHGYDGTRAEGKTLVTSGRVWWAQ